MSTAVLDDSGTEAVSSVLRFDDVLVYIGLSPDPKEKAPIVVHVLRNGVPLPRKMTGLPQTIDGPFEEERCLAHAEATAAANRLHIGAHRNDAEGKLHVRML